jgi:hypothetical protein
MNIDDLFDNLLDDEQVNEDENIELTNWIFPIISLKENGSIQYEGTGFFVNNIGYFVTAGHVLNKKDSLFKAIVNGDEFEFEILHFENENKTPPICEDLAICSIKNFSIKLNLEHTLSDVIICNEVLTFSGYSNKINLDQIKKKVWIDANSSVNFYVNEAIDEKRSNSKRSCGGISDLRYSCKNVRSLNINDHYFGLSGCPVYKNKIVYGLLISDDYILSKYIIEKLNALEITINN